MPLLTVALAATLAACAGQADAADYQAPGDPATGLPTDRPSEAHSTPDGTEPDTNLTGDVIYEDFSEADIEIPFDPVKAQIGSEIPVESVQDTRDWLASLSREQRAGRAVVNRNGTYVLATWDTLELGDSVELSREDIINDRNGISSETLEVQFDPTGWGFIVVDDANTNRFTFTAMNRTGMLSDELVSAIVTRWQRPSENTVLTGYVMNDINLVIFEDRGRFELGMISGNHDYNAEVNGWFRGITQALNRMDTDSSSNFQRQLEDWVSQNPAPGERQVFVSVSRQ